MEINLITFGFKYGQPQANHYFDVSWIINPFRHPEKDAKDLVLNYDGVKTMINIIVDYIIHTHKRDKMIYAIGCNAGRDRSPIIAEAIQKELINLGYEVKLEHRDK